MISCAADVGIGLHRRGDCNGASRPGSRSARQTYPGAARYEAHARRAALSMSRVYLRPAPAHLWAFLCNDPLSLGAQTPYRRPPGARKHRCFWPPRFPTPHPCCSRDTAVTDSLTCQEQGHPVMSVQHECKFDPWECHPSGCKSNSCPLHFLQAPPRSDLHPPNQINQGRQLCQLHTVCSPAKRLSATTARRGSGAPRQQDMF